MKITSVRVDTRATADVMVKPSVPKAPTPMLASTDVSDVHSVASVLVFPARRLWVCRKTPKLDPAKVTEIAE
jgi:hypothetical protein